MSNLITWRNILLLLLSSQLVPSLSISVAHAALPALLKEVETKYSNAKTIQAQFVQINLNAATGQKKTSSGTLHVKRPGKVRWQTLDPDPNILVSNGKTFWFYTPPFEEGEAGQVVIKKSAQVQSRLAHVLLSGNFSENKDMKVKKISPFSFDLFPKKGTAGTIARARIEIKPEGKLIEKVVLFHKDGNQSEISLKKIELGTSLGDELFIFEAPPNTEKIDSP